MNIGADSGRESSVEACEARCARAGPSNAGSVAWTYYSDNDDVETDNCLCWSQFLSLPTGRSRVGATSGRFVPDGNPTPENCRSKCYFLSPPDSFYENLGSISEEQCIIQCQALGGVAYETPIDGSLGCYCSGSLAGATWFHLSKTMVFADMEG